MTGEIDPLQLQPQLPPQYAEVIAPVLPVVKDMSPAQIVDFYRQQQDSDGDLAGFPLDYYVELLPVIDLPKARDVYTAFAESPVADSRKLMGYMIGSLTASDHDFGVRLWSGLVRDPDEVVRETALNLFHELLEDTHSNEQATEYLREFGLTWQDACYLYRDYVDAELGGDIYQPGQVTAQNLPAGQDGPSANQ